MKTSDFDFKLPEELIAQAPPEIRGTSRLLVLDGPKCIDQNFSDLNDWIQPHDIMVCNNTKVLPARLFGKKASGGKIEILVERITSDNTATVQIRANKSPKSGTNLIMDGGFDVTVTGREGRFFFIECTQPLLPLLEDHGHMPLPPYIERSDTENDAERYQTVYAEKPGAVAAPTAGLHFTEEQLQDLRDKGVEFAYVTLHVGAGTFQPVKADNIHDHEMHSEFLEVSAETVKQIQNAKDKGGRVIAIGTTSVRSLETASQDGTLKPFTGDSEIFIYPGKSFHTVDALMTNFHLPQSTLIMLVSAFAGYEETMQAYQHAVKQKYRFFSYGDAMFIPHKKTS